MTNLELFPQQDNGIGPNQTNEEGMETQELTDTAAILSSAEEHEMPRKLTPTVELTFTKTEILAVANAQGRGEG
jgi:hypothetical protein